MAKGKAQLGGERYVVVDGAYMRREARDAAKTFFAPFTGVYRAVTAAGSVKAVAGSALSQGPRKTKK